MTPFSYGEHRPKEIHRHYQTDNTRQRYPEPPVFGHDDDLDDAYGIGNNAIPQYAFGSSNRKHDRKSSLARFWGKTHKDRHHDTGSSTNPEYAAESSNPRQGPGEFAVNHTGSTHQYHQHSGDNPDVVPIEDNVPLAWEPKPVSSPNWTGPTLSSSELTDVPGSGRCDVREMRHRIFDISKPKSTIFLQKVRERKRHSA